MSGISTHVLDLTRGKPADGVEVCLSRENGSEWAEVSSRRTDPDGRVKDMLPENAVPQPGKYRLRFETAEYFRAQGMEALHPFVEIAFEIRNADEHYHVPLLITPHGYSTYRGN
jgi:5-hydroxyisourate hydrolase